MLAHRPVYHDLSFKHRECLFAQAAGQSLSVSERVLFALKPDPHRLAEQDENGHNHQAGHAPHDREQKRIGLVGDDPEAQKRHCSVGPDQKTETKGQETEGTNPGSADGKQQNGSAGPAGQMEQIPGSQLVGREEEKAQCRGDEQEAVHKELLCLFCSLSGRRISAEVSAVS